VPTNVVKTEQDEKDWSTAKHSCRSLKNKGKSRYYRCVMGTFHRIKSNRTKGRD